jgi:hypothetical protein
VTIVGELDILRRAIPGCSLVIFGDLCSRITLCVSSSRKHPQEQLDAYCASAGNLLNGTVANSVAMALGVPNGDSLSQAVVFQPDEIQVFLRSPFENADVLCCVGALQCEIFEVSARAENTFEQIAQVQ